MTDDTTIVLVQCTDTKKRGEHYAEHLYWPSTYYRKQREYARAVGDAWYIQSAEYGLLAPDDVVDYYDTHAKDLDDPAAWGAEIASDLAERHATPAAVHILGGSDYADPLVPELERQGFDAIEPLRGEKIGTRMSRLPEMAMSGTQTTTEDYL